MWSSLCGCIFEILMVCIWVYEFDVENKFLICFLLLCWV